MRTRVRGTGGDEEGQRGCSAACARVRVATRSSTPTHPRTTTTHTPNPTTHPPLRYSLDATRARWNEGVAEARTNPKEAERERERMEEDLKLAAEQLTKVRRERLREQYAEEMAAWQRELMAKGLAIESKRD